MFFRGFSRFSHVKKTCFFHFFRPREHFPGIPQTPVRDPRPAYDILAKPVRTPRHGAHTPLASYASCPWRFAHRAQVNVTSYPLSCLRRTHRRSNNFADKLWRIAMTARNAPRHNLTCTFFYPPCANFNFHRLKLFFKIYIKNLNFYKLLFHKF